MSHLSGTLATEYENTHRKRASRYRVRSYTRNVCTVSVSYVLIFFTESVRKQSGLTSDCLGWTIDSSVDKHSGVVGSSGGAPEHFSSRRDDIKTAGRSSVLLYYVASNLHPLRRLSCMPEQIVHLVSYRCPKSLGKSHSRVGLIPLVRGPLLDYMLCHS